jgi:hypothetical protein
LTFDQRVAAVKAMRAQRLKSAKVKQKKEKPETGLQRRIIETLATYAWCRLERNSRCKFRNRSFGLGDGSADLVGVVRMENGLGRFVALEIKTPKEKAEEHQLRWAREVRELGGFCAVVHSTDEAVLAIHEARKS